MPFGVKDVGVGLHEGQDDGAILQVDVGQVFVHSFWDACALQEPCSLLFRPVVRKTAHLSSSAPGAGSINTFLQNLHFLVLCRFLFSGYAWDGPSVTAIDRARTEGRSWQHDHVQSQGSRLAAPGLCLPSAVTSGHPTDPLGFALPEHGVIQAPEVLPEREIRLPGGVAGCVLV